MPLLRFKRGALASLPTLYAGEPAITTDAGTERFYIGTSSGNMRLATFADLSNLDAATATTPGVVSILSQIFDGIKQFYSNIIVGKQGNTDGYVEFKNASGSPSAKLQATTITSTNKVIELPNLSGTVALISQIKQMFGLGPITVSSGANTYGGLMGDATSATESGTATIMTCAGVFSNLKARKTSLSGGSATVTMRVNGATPSNPLTVSVASASTMYDDDVNTVTVVEGDLVGFLVSGVSANQGGIQISVDFTRS